MSMTAAAATDNYLTFTAVDANSTVKLTKNGFPHVATVQYSTDNGTNENQATGMATADGEVADTVVREAQIFEVSNKADFLAKMNQAVDGDIIKLTSNIALYAGNSGSGDCFVVPQNCLVTLDLNGKTIQIEDGSNSDNVGVGANSALLIKLKTELSELLIRKIQIREYLF